MQTSRKKLSRSSNLVGSRFERLLVIEQLPSEKHCRMWLCQCDCGVTKKLSTQDLPNRKSCGCIKGETNRARLTTHGGSGTVLYLRYCQAKSRCERPSNNKYYRYGARGIKFEWSLFEDFRRDMESSYFEHCDRYGKDQTTLERIDVNGNYSRENCRWATWKEQAANKGNAVYITYHGKQYRVNELADFLGLTYQQTYGKFVERARIR